MGSLLGPALRDGNRVTGLSNGDGIFPQMLAAIRSVTEDAAGLLRSQL